jgi:formylglycine-generating enzyme required for sulfatase activity
LKLLEESPHLREVAENERLLAVLQRSAFEFRPETLDKFIYLSAPPTVEAPPEEAPPEAEVVVPEIAAGREEAVVAEVERQGAEVAVPVFLKMVADETVPLPGRIAAADALGRLGDPRLADMVAIPAGEFIMGEGDEQHRVFVDAFKISKYPVTNMQYQTFVAATGHPAPGHWPEGAYPPNRSNHPVINVSWHDAVAYCRWLSQATGKECRLPTEAEWEKAAGWDEEQGVKRTYPWGNQFDANLCNTAESGIGDTTPVGVYPGGGSSYGLMDMAGNVWEWMATESEGERGLRVLKGGSWADRPDSARVGSRYYDHPRIHFDFNLLGFRVCARRSPPAVDN